MGFLDTVLGWTKKIGGIANKFASKSGWVGKLASGVSKAANLVSTIVPKAIPIVNKVVNVAKLAYNSGLLDKITKGKATRVVKGFKNWISPNRGVTQDVAQVTKQAGATSNTAEMAKMM